jgi:acyl-CoA synthetase (NDP forming)
MAPFQRLFAPKSIAVIGGGAWCHSVVQQCREIGFTGPVWPVHPAKETVGGLSAYKSLNDLPATPDAAFVGVNRAATVEIVRELSAMGCGGAVCFAAGFSEASAELSDGGALQEALVQAAGDMPILGPNCYGFVNALDAVALWPDLHGLVAVDSGVAIIGQSSNVLINLTMQRRGLPLAAVVAVGNQAQMGMAETGLALLEDPRITALGLHIEGITDVPAFEALAARATALKKPVVVLKVGSSDQAQAAAVSHTASLAGSDAGARALFARLGFAQVATASVLIETLKIVHLTGGLPHVRIASASCSGGEASLMADLGKEIGVTYPALEPPQRAALRSVLGERVALANPLDYNTYIWGDTAALTACFTALCGGDIALGCVVIDIPRADRFASPDWDKAIEAACATVQAAGKPLALISLLAEGMPESLAQTLIARGVVPLCGMEDALRAIRAAAEVSGYCGIPTLRPVSDGVGLDPACAGLLTEDDAKAALAAAGVRVPRSARACGAQSAAEQAALIGFPVVLKGTGIAHKTEAGVVALNLHTAADVIAAARAMPVDTFLVEEMISGAVAEVLIGVLRDPVHGFVLTLGLGGILTELIADSVSLLIPASAAQVGEAWGGLRASALLTGYRGRPAADMDAIVGAVMAVQSFVQTHSADLQELEINPLICLPDGAVAADALIRIGD